MSAHDLAQVGAGFKNEGTGSQAVFRVALDALSHPGRCMTMRHGIQVPNVGQPVAAALLLALLDADCTLWLSPSLANSEVAAWLRFHTSCQLVTQTEKAMFAWVGAGDSVPALSCFSPGSDSAPDRSTTCLLDVAQMHAGADGAAHWALRGPGIQDVTRLVVDGLSDDFLQQWAANHASFPRGVDVFLADPTQLAGLPRTTSIQLSGGF